VRDKVTLNIGPQRTSASSPISTRTRASHHAPSAHTNPSRGIHADIQEPLARPYNVKIPRALSPSTASTLDFVPHCPRIGYNFDPKGFPKSACEVGRAFEMEAGCPPPAKRLFRERRRLRGGGHPASKISRLPRLSKQLRLRVAPSRAYRPGAERIFQLPPANETVFSPARLGLLTTENSCSAS
jgi:hypothetical protein